MSSRLGRDHLKLLETGDLADVEIRCQKRVWKAHKLILIARSKWFKRALAGSWKESVSGKIDVSESDPNTMDAVPKYIYTSDVGIQVKCGHICLEKCVPLWIQADFFQLDQMKEDLLTCLRDNFVETTLGLWPFFNEIYRVKRAASWIKKGSNHESLCTDLLKAVEIAYTSHEARDLQKLLTVCAFAMDTNTPPGKVHDLMIKSTDFSQDMYAALVCMRFSASFETDMGVSDDLVQAKDSLHGDWPCKICSTQVGHSFTGIVTIDTITNGGVVWCKGCAKKGLRQQIQKMVDLL